MQTHNMQMTIYINLFTHKLELRITTQLQMTSIARARDHQRLLLEND